MERSGERVTVSVPIEVAAYFDWAPAIYNGVPGLERVVSSGGRMEVVFSATLPPDATHAHVDDHTYARILGTFGPFGYYELVYYGDDGQENKHIITAENKSRFGGSVFVCDVRFHKEGEKPEYIDMKIGAWGRIRKERKEKERQAHGR